MYSASSEPILCYRRVRLFPAVLIRCYLSGVDVFGATAPTAYMKRLINADA